MKKALQEIWPYLITFIAGFVVCIIVTIVTFEQNKPKPPSTEHIIFGNDTVVVTGYFNTDISKIRLTNGRYAHGWNDTVNKIFGLEIVAAPPKKENYILKRNMIVPQRRNIIFDSFCFRKSEPYVTP